MVQSGTISDTKYHCYPLKSIEFFPFQLFQKKFFFSSGHICSNLIISKQFPPLSLTLQKNDRTTTKDRSFLSLFSRRHPQLDPAVFTIRLESKTVTYNVIHSLAFPAARMQKSTMQNQFNGFYLVLCSHVPIFLAPLHLLFPPDCLSLNEYLHLELWSESVAYLNCVVTVSGCWSCHKGSVTLFLKF